VKKVERRGEGRKEREREREREMIKAGCPDVKRWRVACCMRGRG
jgi:hypothetical protein